MCAACGMQNWYGLSIARMYAEFESSSNVLYKIIVNNCLYCTLYYKQVNLLRDLKLGIGLKLISSMTPLCIKLVDLVVSVGKKFL